MAIRCVFSSSKYSQNSFSAGALPRTPLGELTSYDAPPNTLVGWGGGHLLPIPFPPRRLRHVDQWHKMVPPRFPPPSPNTNSWLRLWLQALLSGISVCWPIQYELPHNWPLSMQNLLFWSLILYVSAWNCIVLHTVVFWCQCYIQCNSGDRVMHSAAPWLEMPQWQIDSWYYCICQFCFLLYRLLELLHFC